MRNRFCQPGKAVLALLFSMTLCYVAEAQPAPDALLQQTFESGPLLWRSIGDDAKVSLTHEAANVKTGGAALRFDYALTAGKLHALTLPTPTGIPLQARSLHFWIKADYATSLAVELQERQGGRYQAIFAAAPDTWQEVNLAPDDFVLSEDSDDPPDPDHKLDLDQAQAITLRDFKEFYMQSQNPEVVKLFQAQAGAHSLYLDDFVVSKTPLPPAFDLAASALKLDDFTRPQVGWIAVGAMRLSRANGLAFNKATPNLTDAPSLQADYRQVLGAVVGLAKRLPRGKLAGMARLRFDVASLKPATLLVQLETRSGAKYNAPVAVPGGGVTKAVNLPFTAFAPDTESKNPNERLDLDGAQQLLIVDVTGIISLTNQNSLRLNHLVATTP